MEQLLTYFLSLPSFVIYGIFGAIGGALGALVGSFLSKVFKKEKITQIVVIIFIVLSTQLPKHVLPELKKDVVPAQVLEQLKEHRLFSVIFRLHPEAEIEMKERMRDVINNAPADQVFLKAQAVSAEVVAKYFNKYLVSASDEVTHKMLNRSVAVMKKFQHKPELCVSYYLGQPQFNKEDIPEDFITEQSNLKADIIESAVNNPSLPPKAASIDELLEIIALSYQQNGYDLANLEKIGLVGTLPADEGCRVALEFSNALATLDVKQSSYVFKNLLYLSEQVE